MFLLAINHVDLSSDKIDGVQTKETKGIGLNQVDYISKVIVIGK